MNEELNTTTSTVSDLEHEIQEKLSLDKTEDYPLILITGINGYTASWIAYGALKAGYRVRGTVRDLSNTKKYQHLTSLSFPRPDGSESKIEFFQANLEDKTEANWLAALQGVDYVFHLACGYPVEDPDDPEEIVGPAVNGTNQILKAIDGMEKPPKRFIFTSNLCCCSFALEKKGAFGPDDWAVEDNKKLVPSAYFKAKILTERAVFEYFKKRNADASKAKVEFCAILPGLTLGPLLSTADTATVTIFRRVLMGEIPSLADITFSCCSIFDFTLCHLKALSAEGIDGERFILTAKQYSFKDFSDILREAYSKKGYKNIVSFVAPNFSVRLLAKCGNKEAKSIVNILGLKSQFEDSRTQAKLGSFKTLEDQNIVDLVHSAIHHGILPDLSKTQDLTSSFVMPDFDVSSIPRAPKV